MSRNLPLLLIVLLAAGVAGCGEPAGSLPAKSPTQSTAVVPDAAKLYISWQKPGGSGEPKCVVEVTNTEDVSRFVTALRELDWSRTGVPLHVAADMAAPEIELNLVDTDGNSHAYSFYWSGDALLVSDSAELLTVDVASLRSLVAELPPTSEFETHQRAWHRDRPEAYAFNVSYAGGGVLNPASIWKNSALLVYVVNDKAVAVKRLATGELLREWNEQWPTIDTLFSQIEKERENGTEEMRVVYDARHHVPRQIDIGNVAADRGYQYSITEFRRLSPEQVNSELLD